MKAEGRRREAEGRRQESARADMEAEGWQREAESRRHAEVRLAELTRQRREEDGGA